MDNSEFQRDEQVKAANNRELAIYPFGTSQFQQLASAGHDVAALASFYPDEATQPAQKSKRKSPKE